MSDCNSKRDWGGPMSQQIIEELRAQVAYERQRADDNEAEVARLRQKDTDSKVEIDQKRRDEHQERRDEHQERQHEHQARRDEDQQHRDELEERQQADGHLRRAVQENLVAATTQSVKTTAVQDYRRSKEKRKRTRSESKRERKRRGSHHPLPRGLLAPYYFNIFMYPPGPPEGPVAGDTNVAGRPYPEKIAYLEDLEEFEEWLKERFGIIYESETPVSESYGYIKHVAVDVKNILQGNERAGVRFGQLALEHPSGSILKALLKNKVNVKVKANCNCSTKCNCSSDIMFSDLFKDSQPLAPQRRMKPARPDGVVKRKGDTRPFAVYEYKAPHKFTHAQLKTHLANATLCADVVREIRQKIEASKKEGKDAAPKKNESPGCKVRTSLAKVLTQVYSYMLHCGVRFGLLLVGEEVVLLHVREVDPEVLYCKLLEPRQHLPDQQTGEETPDQLFHTPLAQVSSFLLLALQARPLTGNEINGMRDRTKHNLWPTPPKISQVSTST